MPITEITAKEHRNQLLTVLRDKLPHSGKELSLPAVGGHNYTARICELRALGCEIKTSPNPNPNDTFSLYQLVREDAPPKTEARGRPFLSIADLGLIEALPELSPEGWQEVSSALRRALKEQARLDLLQAPQEPSQAPPQEPETENWFDSLFD